MARIRLEFDKPHNPSQLAAEPRAAGLDAQVADEHSNRFWINADTSADQADIQAVVDDHVPSIPSDQPIGYSGEPYSDSHSFQLIAPDLPLAATAGSDEPTNPKFLAAVMGNVIGDDALENQANYVAGLIGANSLDCSDSDYPTAAVIGVLFDGAQVDSIMLADLDGDDGGAPTNARAAFGVKVNNNNPSSGCEFGVSLKDAGNANYTGGGNAFVPSKADHEFSNGQWLVALDTAITANVTTTTAPAGSLGITSHATGVGKLFMSDGSKWQFAVVA